MQKLYERMIGIEVAAGLPLATDPRMSTGDLLRLDTKSCSSDTRAIRFQRTPPKAPLGSAAAHPDDAVKEAQLADVSIGEGARARALVCHQEPGCIQLCHKRGHGLGILCQEVSAIPTSLLTCREAMGQELKRHERWLFMSSVHNCLTIA